MVMKASAVIAFTRRVLTDPNAVRWTDAELLAWLNESQRQIVAVRPDALSTRATLGLVAGSIQTIPAAGMRFLGATHNTAAFRGVTLISRDQLDAINPSWRGAAPAGVIKHFMYDPQLPKQFEVYPPATTAASLSITYSVLPPDVEAVGNDIALDPIYQPAMSDWIAYRAFLKQSDVPGDAQRSATALQSFSAAMGVKAQVDTATKPERK